jgi:V/A-type H+-transporting ATPase subunit I
MRGSAFVNAMLWPLSLVKFTIRARKDSWLELARALVEFGDVHLIRIREGEGFRPNSKLSEHLEGLAKARAALLSSLDKLGLSAPPLMYEEQSYALFAEVWERALSERHVQELCERAHRIAAELDRIKSIGHAFLDALNELLKGVDVETIRKAKYFTLIVGVGPLGLWEKVSRELPSVEGSSRQVLLAKTRREVVCVLTPVSELQRVRSVLKKKGFVEVDLDVIQALQVLSEVARIEAFLRALVEVTSCFKLENDDLVVEGYVAENDVEKLRAHVQSTVKGIIEFEVEVPIEEVPTKLKPEPVVERLRGFAWARGVPPHWSLDPTLFMNILFATMYGFMFGDLGLGAVILTLGFTLFKSRKPFLGFHPESISNLGMLLMLCGSFSMVFGWLYGMAFLVRVIEHPVISPLHGMWNIIGVALLFGAVQLVVAMLLNVINHVRAGDYVTAIFSGRGVLGIAYYVAGVYLGYVIATNEFRYQVLLQPPHVVALAILLLAMLGVPVASVVGKGRSSMEGVIEVVEMLIEYPANTLSYMRLAMFAIAHEIFALIAEMLGGIAGYLVANLLVLAIEGFAAGIQALRLTYYEFASKLIEEEGIPFTSVKKVLYNRMSELPSR